MVRGVVKSGGYLLNDEEGCEKGYEKKMEAHLQGLYPELVGIILEVDKGAPKKKKLTWGRFFF